MASLLQRLRERKIVQWAVVYLAGAWLVLEALGFVADSFGWPTFIVRAAIIIAAVGLLAVLVLAWYHGEKGRQRASGPELLMIAALLAIAGILLVILGPGEETATTSEMLTSSEEAAVTAPAVEGEKPAIAVLPFDNFSPNPGDAYFADGMHEEIITRLSQISEIKVISRTSVMQYREMRKSVREIAAELGVDFILEGSARKAEDQVLLTVQLIDARKDEHLWTAKYDRDLTVGNLFAIQSDVAERVAAALEVELTASERERIERRPTESLTAYDLYLLGRYYWSQASEEGLKRAISYFEQAIEYEPDFARGYAGLADSYALMTQGWGLAPKEVFPKAREAAARALELDSALAEAHASLGFVRMVFDWDWEGAEAAFERALDLNPNYAPAHHWLALYYSARGQHGEAIEEMKQALALDPLSPYANLNMGWVLYVSRQYGRAAEHMRRAVEANPNSALLHAMLGIAYVPQGMVEKAIAHLEEAEALSQGGTLIPIPYLGYAYGLAGRRRDAERLLEELQESASRRFVNPDYFAIIHLGLGENDQAIEWLYRAYEARTDWPFYLPVDPVTDSIRSDPRFKELLAMVGL